MKEVVWKPKISCQKNEVFISIQAYSGYRSSIIDPKTEEYLLGCEENDLKIGECVLKSLQRSRFLSLEEMSNLINECQKNYELWVEKIKKLYGYKTKKAMFRKMHSCSVELDNGMITIRPSHHEKLEAWGDGNGRITEKDYVIIPEKSSPEEIGAALRLAFSRCTGREF